MAVSTMISSIDNKNSITKVISEYKYSYEYYTIMRVYLITV